MCDGVTPVADHSRRAIVSRGNGRAASPLARGAACSLVSVPLARRTSTVVNLLDSGRRKPTGGRNENQLSFYHHLFGYDTFGVVRGTLCYRDGMPPDALHAKAKTFDRSMARSDRK
jgi:hypothetical protein